MRDQPLDFAQDAPAAGAVVRYEIDDFEDDASRSLLALDLTESGEYRVTVTSYEKGETGGYTLSIDVESTK